MGTIRLMLKILIVDDSELIRHRLAGFFDGLATLDVATTLATARSCAFQRSYDIGVLDLQLPDGHALQRIPEFKQLLPGAQLVVLTNDADPYTRSCCLRAGADWFFDKSTEFEKLLTLVQQQASMP